MTGVQTCALPISSTSGNQSSSKQSSTSAAAGGGTATRSGTMPGMDLPIFTEEFLEHNKSKYRNVITVVCTIDRKSVV